MRRRHVTAKERGLLCSLILAFFAGIILPLRATQPKVKESLKISNIKIQHPARSSNYYSLNSKKMYIVGKTNGSYPNIGPERFELSGIWRPPIKLLKGLYFEIFESTHTENNTGILFGAPETGFKVFENSFHTISFLKETDSLKIVRKDTLLETTPGLVSQVKIHNKSNRPKTIQLKSSLDIDVRPGRYREIPQDEDSNGVRRFIKNSRDGDIIRVTAETNGDNSQHETVLAYDDRNDVKYGLAFASNRNSDFSEVDQQKVHLYYNLSIPAEESVSISFVLTGGSPEGYEKDLSNLKDIQENRSTYSIQKKQHYQKSIFGGLTLSSSWKDLSTAFYSAKANARMLYVDYSPHHSRPYFASSTPLFTQLMGNDLGISIPGLLAAGFHDEVKNSILSLMEYTKHHKITPHQVSELGMILDPLKRTQTTLQLIESSWQYFLYTRDLSFIQQNYDFLIKCMKRSIEKFDGDGDLYLEGHAMVEESLSGSENISAAAYMYSALKALLGLSQTLGKEISLSEILPSEHPFLEQNSLEELIQHYQSKFNQDWFFPADNNFATTLMENGNSAPEQHWISALASYTGLAEKDLAKKSLRDFSAHWKSRYGITSQRRTDDFRNSGTGLVATNIVSTSSFYNGLANFGFELLTMTTQSATQHNLPGLFGACQPAICKNPLQLWSFSTYLESLLRGFVGIKPIGLDHISLVPYFPPKEVKSGSEEVAQELQLDNIQIQKRRFDFEWKKQGTDINMKLKRLSGDPIQLTLSLKNNSLEGTYFFFNGKKIQELKTEMEL